MELEVNSLHKSGESMFSSNIGVNQNGLMLLKEIINFFANLSWQLTIILLFVVNFR